MKNLRWVSLVCALSGFVASPVMAQGPIGRGTRADYERAASLPRATSGRVTNTVQSVTWIDANSLWYTVERGGGRREWVAVNAETGAKSKLLDDSKIAAGLSAILATDVAAAKLPIERLHVTADAVYMLLEGTARVARVDRASAGMNEVPIEDVGAFMLSGSSLPRRGASTAIIVANRSESEVELFWLGGDGRKSYGTVAPGQVKRQHTFGGHRWAIVGKDGAEVFAGEAVDQPSVVVVPSQAAPKTNEAKPSDAGQERRARGRGRGQGGDAPVGDRKVVVRDRNVFLVESGSERQITTNGTTEAGYEGPVVWSPDGERFVVRWTTPAQQHTVHIVESSPRDQLQPKLHSFDYLKPGDTIEVSKPRLFDAVKGAEIAISDEQFQTPWAIDRLEWAADSSAFSFVYNQRGHQVMRLVSVSRDGTTKSLTEEKPDTFVDYVNATYLHRVRETGEVIWMSERDGWRHLYLVNTRDGTVRQMTRGEWVVRGVDRVDEEKRQVWFRVGGIHAEQDPYYIHYARVNFDGSGLTLLTAGDGTHDVEYSPDGRFLIDRYSRIDMPGVTELRRADSGSIVCELERADWSGLLSLPWTPTERFVAPGRDGKTAIYGIIVRPTRFDAAKKYPVIENIYAGPHSAFVPKAFDAHLGTMQDLAELGFIVVQIDGMGTAHRSKAFHAVCWQNIGDSGFPDRIAWMKAAANTRPEMDLTRVGIYGGSAGGQNALRGMLMHGDFYKVAVADCGCHDNRMDKIWWNEAWMGWPIGPHYAEQSNVTQAHRLSGKLLLVVGEMDRNVDPASTMQVANALIKADKDFDLLVMPGVGHGAAESPYGRRRRADFMVRHLLGVEPRAE